MLPYGRQAIDDDDIAAVTEALRSDFLTTGPKVAEFENSLCNITDAKYSVACSNGTTALHLAGLALDLKQGDTVIVPSVTFLATANAVRYCGAEVVFSDVNPETGLMEAKHLEDVLSKNSDANIKAVFPVHLTGQCVDLAAISALAKGRGIKVVGDASHALGGTCNNHAVGACEYEDLSTFSFHPVKTVAMGEGGAVTTNNSEYADRMRNLRSHGMVKARENEPWHYDMHDLGYNYRITDIQCALGVSQLKKLEHFVERRRSLVALYDKLLQPLSPVILPPPKMDYCNPAWHLYAARIDFDQLGISRTEVMGQLMKQGVGTQVHYIPIHTQPYYTDRYGQMNLSGAEKYYAKTLSLPLFPLMNEEDVFHVVETLSNIVKG